MEPNLPDIDADVMSQLAPNGKLRAGMNLGNPVIVQQDPGGALRGIGAALAHELARRLGAWLEFVPFETAGKLADAVKRDAWDVAFLAVDPDRAQDIDFAPAYVHIEGTYLVPADSALQSIEDFDRPGIRIAVGSKTAYDLFLTRTIKHAELVREPSSKAAIDAFLERGLDAVAGVKQPLVAAAARMPGLRVIAGNFMVIRQAAGVPKDRPAAHDYLCAYIEDVKASGFAARALAQSGVEGATIAPPDPAPR